MWPAVPTHGQVPAGNIEFASRYILKYSCPSLRPGPNVTVLAAVSTEKDVKLETSTVMPWSWTAYPAKKVLCAAYLFSLLCKGMHIQRQLT